MLKLNRSDGGHAPIVRQTQAGEGRVEEGNRCIAFLFQIWTTVCSPIIVERLRTEAESVRPRHGSKRIEHHSRIRSTSLRVISSFWLFAEAMSSAPVKKLPASSRVSGPSVPVPDRGGKSVLTLRAPLRIGAKRPSLILLLRLAPGCSASTPLPQPRSA